MQVGSLTWASSSISPQTAEREADIASDLMAQIKRLSENLDKDFAAVNFPTFTVGLHSERGGFLEEEDGITADVVVNSLLPCVSVSLACVDYAAKRFCTGFNGR